MTKAPTLRGSAQARLLLYRLLSHKLVAAKESLEGSDYPTWERMLLTLEEALDKQKASDQDVLARAFSYIEQVTRVGLQKQMERFSGQSAYGFPRRAFG